MIQKMFWGLDTCNCQMILDYDTDADTHTLSEYLQTCSFHSAISDPVQRHTTVKTENNKKNDAHQLILDNAPASMLMTTGNGSVTLKRGVIIDFSWSGIAPDRVLMLTVTGVTLTQQQINKAQTVINNKFGINQVNIVNQP